MRRRKAGNGNPFLKARLAAGMTIPDGVRATGLSPSAFWNIEQGLVASPNPRIKEMLAQVGVDVTGIDEAYQMWRAAQARATIQKFAAAEGARG